MWSPEPQNARRATEAHAGPPFSLPRQLPAPPSLPHKGPDPGSEAATWMPDPTSCRFSDLGPVTPPPISLSPFVKQGGHQPCLSGPLPGPALECQVALSAPDAEDLLRVLFTVGRGGNDEQSVQQVDGDAVGTLVAGAPDPGEQGEGKAVRMMPPERGSPVFLLGTPRPPPSTTAPTHWAKYHLTFSSVGITPDCTAVPTLRQSCCRDWLVLAG